jgi:hypothetical protein
MKKGEILKKTDIYVKPDIRDYGVISFDKGKRYQKRKMLLLLCMKN